MVKLETRCVPVGALPYESIKHTTAMIAKLFKTTPFIPVLPNISPLDTIMYRTFENIPGIEFVDNKLSLKIGNQKYEKEIAELDKCFKNPTIERLEKFSSDALFLEKYFQMLTKFKSANSFINLIGPFTISQLLLTAAQEQVLADKSYRKLFIEAVCVKALWAIEKTKQTNPNTVPIIVLEEPMLGQLGIVKHNNQDITSELVTNMFAKVTEKLHHAGAIVCVQSMDKCDWSIPINAGVDIISFNAYDNPNNLIIIPEILTTFLQKGGMINWGIVPVVSEKMVKGLSLEYLDKRLTSTISGVVLSGVPADLLYNSALISVNGNTDHLPVLFAERAIMFATQLSSRLPVRR